MENRPRVWLRLLGRAALAVAVYHAGIVVAFLYMLASRSTLVQVPLHFAFLLVPLQVVYRRSGPRDFLRVSALAVLVLTVVRVALAASALRELAAAGPQGGIERAVLAPLPGVVFPLIAVELLTVVALLAGLAWLNIYGPVMLRWRTIYLALAATACSAVVALGVIAALAGNHGFVESIKQLFANVMDMFRQAAAQADATLPKMPGADEMLRTFWDYVFGSFVFGYFLNLAGSWYVGGRIGSRNRFAEGVRLEAFALPDVMVWPLIVSWSVVLLGRFATLGYLRAFALNAGLILLALYAVQGLAVIETLLARRRRGPDGRRLLLIGLLVALVVPVLTVVALVVVPLVGVSEIWIRYRIERKEETDEGEGDS
jgi:hypothetical protein